jgi:hypothetical protein
MANVYRDNFDERNLVMDQPTTQGPYVIKSIEAEAFSNCKHKSSCGLL